MLDEDKNVVEADLETWATEFSNMDRTVEKTTANGLAVSTVFLGLDHSWDDDKIEVFETMVFPLDDDDEILDWSELECVRYGTYQEAVDGHKVVVDKALAGEYDADIHTECTQE